jgi:antitoxin MazE
MYIRRLAVRTKVQKWGNSLAVRIPAAMALDIQLEAGDAVELSIVNGTLAIRPATDTPTFEELLASIPPGMAVEEVDFDPPVGKEPW